MHNNNITKLDINMFIRKLGIKNNNKIKMI